MRDAFRLDGERYCGNCGCDVDGVDCPVCGYTAKYKSSSQSCEQEEST